MNRKKAQIAIEFLLLTTLSLFFLAAILVILSTINTTNTDIRREKTLEDLGASVKNEIAIASEMEDGYHREINIPKKVNGQTYNISIEEGISGISYLVITADMFERYYSIPETNGTIKPGKNLIVKNENITISYIG